MKRNLCILAVLLAFLMGCGATKKAATPTLLLATEVLTPTIVPLPTLVPALDPNAVTEEPEITLYYEENAQVEIVNSAGMRVLIDVSNPAALSSPATADDILLTTHSHFDHVNSDFLKAFTGQQLYIRTGEISLPGLRVYGIAAAHDATTTSFAAENGSDYIFVIETDGLRIAHLGDIGQDRLTEEQLQQLGEIDIVFMQLENSYSQMDMTNKKGFNLLDQFKPKLVIPTHQSRAAVEYAAKLWGGGFAAEGKNVGIGKSDIPETTKLLMMGGLAKSYMTLLKLQAWPESAK